MKLQSGNEYVAIKLLAELYGQRRSESIPVEPMEQSSITSELSQQFFNYAHFAAYNVFQLVGRTVSKQDGNFVYSSINTSHIYPSPATEYINKIVDWRIRERVTERLGQLGSYCVEERRKVWRSRPITNTEPTNIQQLGNVIVVVSRDKGNIQRLIIYGGFSTESRSDYWGGRLNPDNTAVFFFPDDENGTRTIDNFLESADTASKLHSEGTINNYKLIKSIICGVFPQESPVTKAVETHMLRELEIQQIVDLR